MKRVIILLFLFCTFGMHAYSQTRYAFVDMEYILNNIPDYAKVLDELNAYSLKLQGEVDVVYKEIADMQSKYNSDKVFLTPVMREQREKAIAELENKARLLQQNYFGPSGDLFLKREELVKPLLDDINDVIKDIAKDGNYGGVWDISNKNSGVLYFDPKLDKSNTVLRKLGYSTGKSLNTGE
ncbi:OmpH family outer membrane protein [Porphyromonadaceae bacterium OttesenSCG-928-L07]|nr:OmpH family outer membrane protein [Porphyromonadaceae bacterium OttesenSCG-928-L07]MDL2251885.1 OmpH family outer membrane protein [Odoribacter sp. OttesenSCG-928-J03]MDL2283386.1 OmpH family outer membrane protein [Odoribacter sp. OttesenSCG-928-G04]